VKAHVSSQPWVVRSVGSSPFAVGEQSVADQVIVDTSVWVEHLRRTHAGLVALLEAGNVVVHPYVIGELACGNLAQRARILALLSALPAADVVAHAAVLQTMERFKLMGRGLGWVDVCLLASAFSSGLGLWTLDRKLARAALALGVATHAG
jgi:predicted nucleic acid-binding protein